MQLRLCGGACADDPHYHALRWIDLLFICVHSLVIFFSYEYLRSVNCTLEFLVALRYRGHPQRTVILLEAIGEEVSGKSSIGKALTSAEAHAVADILRRAVPGLLVATSVDQLLTMLDENCVRATTKEDTAAVIEWWALHGSAQTARSPSDVKVIPPLLRRQLKHYWSCICSCSRRSPGDVAGGFALLSGDSKRVSWYRPPDPASLAMLGVIGVQVLLHAHMFIYCLPAIIALTSGVPAFAGSCSAFGRGTCSFSLCNSVLSPPLASQFQIVRLYTLHH